jgi:putative membrane protein
MIQMKKQSIMMCMLAISVGFSSCMDGGKGKRADTPSIDSISDSTSKQESPRPVKGEFNKEEQTFIFAAATGGNMEVEAGTLAVQRVKNAEIKAFAEQMISDHGKAGQELRQIAGGKGANVPDSLTTEQLKHLNGLKALNDQAFEKQYMTMMIADHAKTVRLFDDGTRLPNADLKGLAAKTLPVIRHHWEMAVKIGKKLNLKNVNVGDDLQGASPATGHTN